MTLKVLIVAEHASAQFGGEAILPLHYYQSLRQRHIEAWLVVHERTRRELDALFAADRDRIFYVPDTRIHRWMSQLEKQLPKRLAYITTGFLSRLITQLIQRRMVRRLVQDKQLTVVHQPIPVSPKEPSMMFGLGVPVVMGPMNGGIKYPPAFQRSQNQAIEAVFSLGQFASNVLNRLMPGKRQAEIVLVANDRTRNALPRGCKRVVELPENGVDLALWQPKSDAIAPASVTRFVFVGRLVDWKAIDLLLLAFQQAASQAPISLEIIGAGPEQANLEQQAQALGLSGLDRAAGSVQFSGWLFQPECAARLQQSDALVLPSLRECGGAVVLEAMAAGIPAIATDWGGPADYLDETCGILVKPESRAYFIEQFAAAMVTLARSPAVRQAMGKAGQERVRQRFNWSAKVDRMVEIYHQAIAASAVSTPAPANAPSSAIELNPSIAYKK